MDNVIVFTTKLRTHRSRIPDPDLRLYRHCTKHLRAKQRQEAFQLWIDSLNPLQCYVFYRVTGPCELVANPHVQIKLYLSPHLLVEGTNIIYPLFKDPFTIFAHITDVKPQTGSDDWYSAKATVVTFPGQAIQWQVPVEHRSRMKEILGKLILPTKITGRGKHRGSSFFDSISEQQFDSFHLLYHPSKKYTKRYGYIDQMWDFLGNRLELATPPEIQQLFH